ncbi:cupin domain-containing protein [uncultured Microbacterium sp.]|uniref:cupin domain-containing protein n=1 Tax=uncultured Microbacterium sp. TaxID=191216 RepID=UPI0025E19D4A|nr:cupin domain-containing protein [uncultured Microbacterium sp.]
MRDDAPITVTQARDRSLDLAPVADEQIVRGQPRTGFTPVTTALGVEIGVWEMTSGAMTDVETDEVFVVVEGEGTVSVLVDGRPTESFPLAPGVVCRLTAGTTALWEIPHRLRKVYVTAAPPSP